MQQGSQAFVLCGGIGSGKSYVAALFADHGVDMIEADKVGHEILAADGPAFAAVAHQWPGVDKNGRIDRRALGEIVFRDPEELVKLESITHPLIAAEIERRVEASSASLVGIERPLLDGLVGAGLPLIVVDAPESVRIDRLADRGMGVDDIGARMAAQPHRSVWLQRADFVIDNDLGADLDPQVVDAIRWLESFVSPVR